jgi:DNA-binding transcriptional MocR family regulator
MIISPEIFDSPQWKSLSSSARGIFAYLVIRSGKDATSYPSINRTAEDMRHHRKTIIAAYRELTESGFISRQHSPGKKAIYTIQPVPKAQPVSNRVPVLEIVPVINKVPVLENTMTGAKLSTAPVLNGVPEQDINKYITDNHISPSLAPVPQTEPVPETAPVQKPASSKIPDLPKSEKGIDFTGEVEEIYKLYPGKDLNNDNRSTGKSPEKDKAKILKKLKAGYPLKCAIEKYLSDCRRTNTYLKNFGTFLNNLPDVNEVVKSPEQAKLDQFEAMRRRGINAL